MSHVLGIVLTVIGWVFFALNPTVASAAIAAAASIANTWLILRHEKRVNTRLDERRNVVVKGVPDDEEAVFIRGEERRQLDRRKET